MRSILGAGIVALVLLPEPAMAQAAQTTVGPGGLRLPQVIAGQPPAPTAGSDGAVAAHTPGDCGAGEHRPLGPQHRPQPRLDRDKGAGMTVTVGRIRPCEVHHVKMFVLSHNLLRGAAGAALLNAELCHARGLTTKSAATAAR